MNNQYIISSNNIITNSDIQEGQKAQFKGDNSEKIYSDWLCTIDNIGHKKILELIRIFKSCYNVFHASEKEIDRIPLLTEKDKRNIINSRDMIHLDDIRAKCESKGIRLMTMFDDDYPEQLESLSNPPKLIYVRGDMPELGSCVAIVGARACSVYGRENARGIGKYLAERGLTIVSGMARGIDGWAHHGALEGGGKTVAVLGSGIDVPYPKENGRLYKNILENGAIISEYGPGVRANPSFFLCAIGLLQLFLQV